VDGYRAFNVKCVGPGRGEDEDRDDKNNDGDKNLQDHGRIVPVEINNAVAACAILILYKLSKTSFGCS
jgi:hypothetical protein